jgi:hypothetical protein
MPVYTVTPAVLTERKAALYGISGGDPHEERLRVSIREELGAALPRLFESKWISRSRAITDSLPVSSST